MHRAIAERVRTDPTVIEGARVRVERWRSSGRLHAEYLDAWANVLALPLDELCAALVDPGERAQALRQVTPFAGVLSPRERWRILEGIP